MFAQLSLPLVPPVVTYKAAAPARRQSEDVLDRYDTISLSDAKLEESWQMPGHGYQSVHDYIDWFSDGEDARYETN